MRKMKLRAAALAMSMMVGFTGIPDIPNICAEEVPLSSSSEYFAESFKNYASSGKIQAAKGLAVDSLVETTEEENAGVDTEDAQEELYDEMPVEEEAVVDKTLDTDGDGLLDYLEDYLGTDKENADTDGDGLSDYWEVRKIKTDPLKADTDGNGVEDGQEDADNDGLTNLAEIEMGTNPVKADTDEDGLNDGDEVYVHHTSPILSDTDGDGLLDGEEVTLDLSPIRKFTKGIEKDCKRLFSQSLGKKYIDELLRNANNKAIPSISGKIWGVLDSRVSIEPSTVVTGQFEEAVVGNIINVVSSYEEPVEMKLTFSCFHSTWSKIKKYKIAQFKDGEIVYLNTKVIGNLVSATITEGGDYFVVDTANPKTKGVAVMAMATGDKDTDYDGVPDSSDPKPNDNSFVATVNNKDFGITERVSYAVDYRSFFSSATTYKSQLCKNAALYAQMAYGFTLVDEASGKTMNMSQLMQYQGLSHVEYKNLASSYSDDDVSAYYIGHRTVTYNGVTKDIIVIAVKGTNERKEWYSNFDIGTTTKFSNYPDWTTSANHKGFDVAAVRIQKQVASYVSSYVSGSNQKVYFITGHSRGGAIANIIGASLTDKGNTAYTYTFASPNTTTKSATTCKGYKTIFNIVNKDDFVTYLPCNVWGFRRYGLEYKASIADNYEKEWEDFTGINDYNPDTLGMQDTIDEMGAVFSSRNNAYVYTCKCHGDGSSNNITIKNRGMSKSSREEAIAKIPSNMLPYCKITRYTGSAFWGWDFEVCQTPCYFMQDIAAVMGGTIDYYRFVVELNIADRYEDAKSALIASAIGGVEHPHYTESYNILAKHATASSFS